MSGITEITGGLIKKTLGKRNQNSHKGDYGHTAVVAGSLSYTGAAAFCSRAASRVGSGLVTLCSVNEVCSAVARRCGEVIFMRFEKTPDGALPATAAPSILACRATAYALGCGLKKTPDTVSLTQRLIASAARPIVLDADGLNCIAEDKSVLLHKKSDIIITPHVGEMSRLTGIGVKEIALSRVQTARRFAEEYGVTVVLKGHETVIAAPGGETYVNTTGNAGMAKGGSGDILAGMIAGFSAQGFSPALAAACGVYLHGAAGDIAAERYSEWAMLPDDLSNCLPDAFKAVLNG